MSEETCKHGHPWTPENTKIVKKTGARQCRTCIRAAQAREREQYKKPNPGFQHFEQRQPKVKARA
jgi:hypothetical protein